MKDPSGQASAATHKKRFHSRGAQVLRPRGALAVAVDPKPARRTGVAFGAALVALALSAGALLSFHWMYEPDLGWHLAQGREIAAGHLVRTNLFSAGHAAYPQPFEPWLFDLGLFGLSKIGGAAAIQTGQAVTIAVTLAIIYLACRRRCPKGIALAVATFGAFLIEPRAVPRPHTVSFALGACTALLLERARERRSVRPLIWTIPLIALWSNLHAESLFGAALVGLFAIGELLRPQILLRRQAWIGVAIAAVCVAANVVNPFGLGLFAYLWQNARTPAFIPVAEFRPAYLPTYAPFFVYLACGVGLMFWKRRSLALWEVLVFGGFGILALRHVRFVSLFLCVTAPIVAARLGRLSPRTVGVRWALAALLAGMLVSPVPLEARFKLSGVGSAYIAPPTLVPSGAAGFIREAGLEGPVFNSVNLGGYLIWNAYPSVRVFHDTRFQSYPPQHFESTIAAFRSQSEWEKVVAGIDWAVITLERNTPLTGYGRFPAAQWAEVYRDTTMVIVVRRSGRFGVLAAR